MDAKSETSDKYRMPLGNPEVEVKKPLFNDFIQPLKMSEPPKLVFTKSELDGEVYFTLEQAPEPRLIERVSETTRGRRDDYGRPLVNFLRIAIYWTEHLKNLGILERFITPEDVAQMMTGLKLARSEHSYTDDNVLDIMGYQDCIDDMNCHMKELGYPGVSAFRELSYAQMLQLRDDLVKGVPHGNSNHAIRPDS